MIICNQCGTELRIDQTFDDVTRCVYCGGPVEVEEEEDVNEDAKGTAAKRV